MDYTGYRDFAPAMENHKEEKMEHEVATGIMKGLWMETLHCGRVILQIMRPFLVGSSYLGAPEWDPNC